MMDKIAIFCSASENIEPVFFEKARELGVWMGQNKKTLVYGGANIGLMECIAEATKHLRGLKIGVMGCIVNGPGEMADADYGYVGSAPGKVDLYKAKERLKRNIPQEEAVKELIELIKAHGDWKDPE